MSQPAQTEGQGTESKDAGRGPDARLLEINALSVSIGSTHIIKNLSLELGAGEILGLVGASGSGKTLTALAIMQLLPARARAMGTVRWRGESLGGKSEGELCGIRGRDIGMVFQEPMTALNPLMRVGEQVA
ncbi:MAG: ATP-binding cassette domain-containing protein, partial [Steroidobacteraceae bacterium]